MIMLREKEEEKERKRELGRIKEYSLYSLCGMVQGGYVLRKLKNDVYLHFVNPHFVNPPSCLAVTKRR